MKDAERAADGYGSTFRYQLYLSSVSLVAGNLRQYRSVTE